LTPTTAQRYVPIKRSFFARDTVTVARELLGVCIVRQYMNETLVARIVETEGYTGDDPACHAYSNHQRKLAGKPPVGRSVILFGEPGHAYVYFNYGMYDLFNVVTEVAGCAGAVLVRAVEPLAGMTAMQKLRPTKKIHDLTNGPGKLCLALAIDRHEFNGIDLINHPDLYLAKPKGVPALKDAEVVVTTRIGISKGQEHPWRFYVKDNPFVSKA